MAQGFNTRWMPKVRRRRRKKLNLMVTPIGLFGQSLMRMLLKETLVMQTGLWLDARLGLLNTCKPNDTLLP